MSLLQKLADDKPVDTSEKDNKLEVTIIKRTKVGSCEYNQRSRLFESITEEVPMETKSRRKKCHERRRMKRPEQIKSPVWLLNEEEGEAENLSGQSEESDEKLIQVKMSEKICASCLQNQRGGIKIEKCRQTPHLEHTT